jgi:hypothetical protein
MPGSHANIDVPAIAPTGLYVIDVKANRGKVRVAIPLLSAERLLIEGRNQTKMIDGLERQICAVRDALSAGGHPDNYIYYSDIRNASGNRARAQGEQAR